MTKVRVDLDTLTARVNSLTGGSYTRTTVSTARASSKGGKQLLKAIQDATRLILVEEAKKVSGGSK